MAINRDAYKSLVESVQDTVTQQNLVEWPITIGGRTANNPRELAQILNSMQNDKQSGSSPSVPTGVAGASRKTNTPSISKTMGATPIAENEQWDILDEILAEGLELYGEDGLTEILADFAETGEMSQELADLLSDEYNQLDELSNETMKSYIRKSERDIKKRVKAGGYHDPAAVRKMIKRTKGIGLAHRNIINSIKI